PTPQAWLQRLPAVELRASWPPENICYTCLAPISTHFLRNAREAKALPDPPSPKPRRQYPAARSRPAPLEPHRRRQVARDDVQAVAVSVAEVGAGQGWELSTPDLIRAPLARRHSIGNAVFNGYAISAGWQHPAYEASLT